MKIIGGFAKGRKLIGPPGRTDFIRPTSERAREALFNILGVLVQDALVLDLFAGTGALGLESLSRGARHIVFVDNDRRAIDIIKKNISLCLPDLPWSADQQGRSVTPVTVLKRNLKKKYQLMNSDFDLIFVDPPYSKGLALHCLKRLVDSPVVAQKALIIVEERSNEKLPKIVDPFILADQRRYGDTAFWFYRRIKP